MRAGVLSLFPVSREQGFWVQGFGGVCVCASV